MTEHPISTSEHQYNLLAELHDRLQDLDVYRGYLSQAENGKNEEWAAVWHRMIEDAENAVAFMRAEVERRSIASSS